MSIIKVIEVMSNSTKSWEDATQNAIYHASKSIHNIRSIWIQEHSAIVNNNKVTEYRINAKISFEIDLTEH